jgi:alpha-L-fucosidase
MNNTCVSDNLILMHGIISKFAGMIKLIWLVALLAFPCSNFTGAREVLHNPPKAVVLDSCLILHRPPFAQCHASTLASLSDGSILVAFFGGSYEGAPDVKIWGMNLKNGVRTGPRILADGIAGDTLAYPCWNPVLYRTKQGLVYLFYKVGKNPREWHGMMKTSRDQGMTWSEAVRLPDGILGPVRNKPVELPGNLLLCGSSKETDRRWAVHMEILNMDNGIWTDIPVDPETRFEVIQPTILSYSPTSFRILCRSKQNIIVTSTSKDGGRSWSNLVPTRLPNPNSGIDGITLEDGSHLLVYNPLTSGKEWQNGRNRLNLAWSPDGTTWTDIRVLEDHPEGEYSYPAIIQSADRTVHITYTRQRNQVKYWKLRLEY